MHLERAYEAFLKSVGRLDSSGEPIVELGGKEARLPDRRECEALQKSLSKAIARWKWILLAEVSVALLLAVLGFAILTLARTPTARLAAVGLDLGFISSLLVHVHRVWRDVVEAEIAVGVVANMPPGDVLRFMELRYVMRKHKRTTEQH
jgi:hypothetical protein